MRLMEPVEFLYLARMLRWEKSAPADQHQGFLDGEPQRNTQISRFAFVVNDVAVGQTERNMKSFERSTRRNDGKSYISKDRGWMKEAYPLLNGWFFEGCCSLEQKKEFLGHLQAFGLSRGFVACARDFVEGKSVKQYLPTPEEEEAAIKRYQEREARTDA